MDGEVRTPYVISNKAPNAMGAPRQEETYVMTSPIAGGVDCDLHPALPHLTTLLP
jgi:hypothetical protein